MMMHGLTNPKWNTLFLFLKLLGMFPFHPAVVLVNLKTEMNVIIIIIILLGLC
jgi:hypothetical protein